MIDLGYSLYRKNYFFQQFLVHQLLINPKVKGYPPIFLICRDRLGEKRCEFIIGLTFEQFNQILMVAVDNKERNSIAEKMGDFLMSTKKFAEISIPKLLGKPLTLQGLDFSTRIRKFQVEPGREDRALYYFQLLEI
ncbi:hypothetical protein O3Q51_11895 [Cryomorphaceae bacterium 1068]|nr:hypothetical protein [Cryomorphaceae bacterium 1068]